MVVLTTECAQASRRLQMYNHTSLRKRRGSLTCLRDWHMTSWGCRMVVRK